MATAEELLAQMEKNPELYSDSVGPVNDVIVIDAETRIIELPESEKIFGVESDKASERKYFKCPRIVGDNIDLSTLNLFINFKNANNEGDIYAIDDVVVDGDYITFSWKLSRKVTAYKTDASKNQLLSFIFCAKNGEGPENEWNTTLCSDGIILEGLEPGESIVEDNPDIIQYILERLDSAGTITPEQISGAVEEYFVSNPIEEIDPTVPAWAKEETPDKTLSEEGKAADAKEVGDRLGQLSDDIDNLSKNGLTTEQINALDGMFKVTAFSEDPTSAYNAFKTAFGITTELIPATGISLDKSTLSFTDSSSQTLIATVEPSNSTDSVTWESSDTGIATVSGGVVSPVSNGTCTITAKAGSYSATCEVTVNVSEEIVTLQSISATYTGGDVAVGTALTDLTGITVTATYSDGSTENVTGYALSGEIVAGKNTITVSYGGKTTTFAVTGVSYEEETTEPIYQLAEAYTLDGTVTDTGFAPFKDVIPKKLAFTICFDIEGVRSTNGTYASYFGFDQTTLLDCRYDGWFWTSIWYGAKHRLNKEDGTNVTGNTMNRGKYVLVKEANSSSISLYSCSFENVSTSTSTMDYASGGINITYENTIQLGGSEDYNNWESGFIYDFKWYNRVLSDDEIASYFEEV